MPVKRLRIYPVFPIDFVWKPKIGYVFSAAFLAYVRRKNGIISKP